MLTSFKQLMGLQYFVHLLRSQAYDHRYDHLLFFGCDFLPLSPKHVVQYVTLFAVGHSITLLQCSGNISVNAYIIDTIIGLSIVYKAFENIDGFKQLFGFEPNTKIAVFIFGLFHGRTRPNFKNSRFQIMDLLQI